MSTAGQALTKQFHQGRVEIEIDLPKGEDLKSARASLIVNSVPIANRKLKKGKNRLTYYSQADQTVSLTVQGEMRNNQGVFSERLSLKGGETEPVRIRLAFSKPAKVKKAKPAKAKKAEAAPAEAPKATATPAPKPEADSGPPPTVN